MSLNNRCIIAVLRTTLNLLLYACTATVNYLVIHAAVDLHFFLLQVLSVMAIWCYDIENIKFLLKIYSPISI